MAEAGVDTSSYPKLPTTQQNPLDTISKIQGIQQGNQQIQRNNIAIDSEKLGLVNQKWDMISKRLGGELNNPDLSSNSIVDLFHSLNRDKLISTEDLAKEVSSIPTFQGFKQKNPNATEEDYKKEALGGFLANHLLKGATKMEQLNWYAGHSPSMTNVGNAQVPTQQYHGTLRPTGGPVPTGLPVTTPGYDSNQNREVPIGAPTFPKGNQGPSGGFPGQGAMGQSALPTASPAPSQANPSEVPTPSVTPGNAPFGRKEASDVTGRQSGEQLASARDSVANYQQRVLPLEKGIDALEKLGTKGTGPGTETINQVKSFFLSNIPGIKEEDLASVKDFDSAKKYFTQYVNENGNSGTNDKLAAAFSGNPSTSISNAAATDVAKTALTLAKMKVAMTQEFEHTGKPDDQYGKWISTNFNKYDPRAFGVDKLSPEAATKLRAQLDKDPKARKKFEESLSIAHELGLIK